MTLSKNQKDPAMAEYERIRDSAWAERQRICAAAWADYKRKEEEISK